MAKDFSKANSANKFKDVAKASEEKANVIQIKMITNENLFDYPRNNEDLSYTADLETSMIENGFTDPIEVTGFGMEEGLFTIISGHRRRIAGVNVGYTSFPCIVRTFKNETDVHNYVLSSNAQRNAVADPLLYCKRYKMHEEYLKESNFKGSMREEIAKRLGISSQQADRYNHFNDIILPAWDMVRDEKVGMSSVMPMASHTTDEQEEILVMLNECLESGGNLTRDVCSFIIKAYRDGVRSYHEINDNNSSDSTEIPKKEKVVNFPQKEISVVSVNTAPTDTAPTDTAPTDTTPTDTTPTDTTVRESSPLDRNNEVNYQGYEKEKEFEQKPINTEKLSANSSNSDSQEVSKEEGKEKKGMSEDEKRLIEGDNLSKLLSRLDVVLNNYYSFENTEKAQEIVSTMFKLSKTVFAEIESITTEYKLDENSYKNSVGELIKELETYK